MSEVKSTKDQVIDKSWQELAREAQLEREELRCKTVEQAVEIERLLAKNEQLEFLAESLGRINLKARRTMEVNDPVNARDIWGDPLP